MFIKKLLTTTSTLALVAGASSIALGTSLTTTNNPSGFNTSGNWTPAQVVNTGDSLVMGGLHRINANLDDIYITGISGSNVMRELVVINTGLVVGNITSSSPSSGSTGNIDIRAGLYATLVGGDSSSRTTAAAYGGLDSVDFSGAGAVLTIDTSAVLAHPIDGSSAGAGDAIDFDGTVTNGSNGTLNINTNLNTKSTTWFDIDTINIGTANAAAQWANDLGSSKVTITLDGSKINFLHDNSYLLIDSISAVDVNGSFGGNTDLSGRLEITTRNDTGTSTLSNNTNGSLGVSNTQRLRFLYPRGAQSITIDVPVYAQTIFAGMFSGGIPIIFNDVVDSGAAGALTCFGSSNRLTFNEDTSITNIDFNDNATVQVDGGNLTANDITNDLTVTGGTVTSAGTVGGDLAVSNAAVITKVTNITGDVTLSDTADVSIANDVGGTLDTGANNTLTFTGAGTVTGAVNTLGGMTIQADRTFTSATLTTPSIEIEGADTDITLTAGDLGAANITTNQVDSSNDIIVNATQTITGDIGTANNPLGNLILNADVAANINTTNFYAGVTTNTTNEGSVVFDADGAMALSLGAANALLNSVTFNEDASVTSDVYATTITVEDAKTATLSGIIESSNFTFGGTSAQITFSDGAVVNSAIAGGSTGGIANFAGDITIKNNIGSAANALTRVNFTDTAAKETKLGANVYATDIITNQGAVTLTKDVSFTGNTATNSTTFDLGSYNLSKTGNLTISGTNTVKFNMVDTGASSTITGGKISGTGVLTFSNGSVLILQPQDTGITRNVGQPRKFVIVSASGAQGVSANQIQIIQNNKAIKWTASVDSKGITLTEGGNAKTYLQSNINVQDAESVDAINQLSELPADSSGGKIVDLLIDLAEEGNTEKLEEALDRITDGSRLSTDITDRAMSDVGDALSNRVLTLDAISLSLASMNTTTSGVAAGDDCKQMGVWTSPFYGKTTQGSRANLSGYTNESYGIGFGFDTRVSEDAIIGAAITVSNSNIKHKGSKSGDRTRMNSFLFSIYGLANITNQAFFLGSTTFSKNQIQNHAKRVASTSSYEMANSKYNANSFSMKGMFGYNKATERAIITPMLGLKYSKVAAAHYKESGASFQNFEVSTKPQGKFNVIAGVRSIGALVCDFHGMMVTSEARGFVDYTLTNRSPQQTVKVDSVKLVSASKKPSRLKYNLGIGVNSELEGAEYSASYDLNLSDKLVGHQGALKVRVNF